MPNLLRNFCALFVGFWWTWGILDYLLWFLVTDWLSPELITSRSFTYTQRWAFLDISCLAEARFFLKKRGDHQNISTCALASAWVWPGECLWMWWLPQRRTVFGQTYRKQTWGWRSGSAEWRKGESCEVCIHMTDTAVFLCQVCYISPSCWSEG